jgi:flagellar protein FliS
MFGLSKPGANAYAKVSLETGVISASPHELIVMLFDGAITSLYMAGKAMEANNIEDKSKAISKAVNIVNEGLRSCLNKKQGGEIAANLDDLYQYISARIMQGNIRNDKSLLDEASRLLTELRDAWKMIDPKHNPAAALQRATAA